jgi:hypothetical protein
VRQVLLERLESVVEGVVEGAFGLELRGKIEPLEIARRLTREAEERKIITLNRVYVPNEFVVGLHPNDMAVLEPIAQELEAEFQRYVGEWVMDREYTVTGPIHVTLTAQERVGRGRLRIQAAVNDLRLAEESARKRLGFEFQMVKDETVGCLEVEAGPDEGQTFTLMDRRMILGRAEDCDLRLEDPEVPEHCALIERAGNTWRVEELDGAPPILLNDREEHDGLLTDGDLLRIGGDRLRFQVARSSAEANGDGD